LLVPCVIGLVVLCGCVAALDLDSCSAVDPPINTKGICHNNVSALNLGIWGYSVYSYQGHNYLVNAQKTYNEFWNVDDPFNPRLVKNTTGLNECRGPVYTNTRKLGNYLIHFGSSQASCNCEEGKPCMPYVNASINGVVSTMKLCDNSIFPVNTQDVSAPAEIGDPEDACDNMHNLNGKIAIIERGGCSFQEKVNNALDAGAVGIVIVNSEFTNDCINVRISTTTVPVVMISFADATPIINALNNKVPVIISLGPTYFINFDSTQPAPFDSVWGTSQYVQIAHFNNHDSSDYIQYADSLMKTIYNPVGIIGLTRRPDAENTKYFIMTDTTKAVVASVSQGKFSLVTDTFILPADNLQDISNGVFFVRNGTYWLASPNKNHDELDLYSITNIPRQNNESAAPVVLKTASVALHDNQVALPVPPHNNFIYANSATSQNDCDRGFKRFEVYNTTTISDIQLVNYLQTTIKNGGGADRINNGDFLKADDGTIVGAICATSEGVLLFSASDPANPIPLGSFDSSSHEGDFVYGAVGCNAGTDGLTWWFKQIEDRSVCAVQLAYGPGSKNSGSSLVVNAFVGMCAVFLAVFWN